MGESEEVCMGPQRDPETSSDLPTKATQHVSGPVLEARAMCVSPGGAPLVCFFGRLSKVSRSVDPGSFQIPASSLGPSV